MEKYTGASTVIFMVKSAKAKFCIIISVAGHVTLRGSVWGPKMVPMLSKIGRAHV